MPTRNKRKAEEFDPNKSDSADSTYGASASRPTRSRPTRSQPGKQPARKKQRRKLDEDASDEISNDSLLSDVSFEEHVEDEPELDENTGRPKRQAAKNRPVYQEESDDEIEDAEEVPDPVPQEILTPKKKGGKPRSLVLKLNVSTPQPNPAPAPTRRSTRARSGSVGNTRAVPSGSGQVRRSSRIAHDDSDPIVALTDSGHHMDIIRPGTRSPETNTTRAKRGGKGIKKLPTSVVYEEEEESAAPQHQTEVAASHEDPDEEREDSQLAVKTDEMPMQAESELLHDVPRDEVAVIPESGEDEPVEEFDDDDDEEEEQPISKLRRTRQSDKKNTERSPDEAAGQSGDVSGRPALRSARSTRKTRSSQKSGREESSDFEPGFDEAGEEDISDSEASISSPRKASQQNDEDNSSPGTRGAGKGKSRNQRPVLDEHDSEVAEELAEELQDLRNSRSRRKARPPILFDDRPNTRKRKPVDYRILKPDAAQAFDDDGPPATTTPSRRAKGGGGGTWQRSLFSTYGPFGGASGPTPVLGGPGGVGAAAGAHSDSSDDDLAQRPRAPGVGGVFGMTPTAAAPSGLGLFPAGPGHGPEALGAGGTPANLGKMKDKSLLADADPLGVDQNVNFDGVGGLQGHIDQLKEMVALPLLYPEIFQRFRVTPPRGVLFHGPPGTGKTLLARALASSVSSQGRKVTFYMRKGADALSKWVGEAEKQLRLLFEEARRTQPSIIFFDEIDGLAPVRSSKQEQIHASIVSTLLALMDGMDGRGQVIVIGATNRPDSIDPALRRPGRFDREFYFPLPNTEARRCIIDIHTKGWVPPLASSFKDEIAGLTKGYGGADLRALCTEAALNAVQRRYPQIYKTNEKLEIKPETINVTAKDFMISIKKIVPSSQRSASSGAAPLPVQIEPLLRNPLAEIENLIGEILPRKKRLTALEEAEFEEAEDDRGMKTERMQQEFERSRVFRPRLLVRGLPGMGQQYLAGALLNHFEGLHVQAFDLPTLLGDSSRSPDAAVIQLFTEVRRHKPSVIYIPNVDTWYRTVGEAVVSVFRGLVRSLAPTEPVLLLGILESENRDVDPRMIKDLFGFSRRNQFEIDRPSKPARQEYFSAVVEYINIAPTDFPEPAARKKRKLEVLKPVPPEPPKDLTLTKDELKLQKRRDRLILNHLKLRIQPIMDQIKLRYKKFRTGVIDESQIRYLYEEDDPDIVSTDVPPQERRNDHFRPYEKSVDKHGDAGLLEVASGKFYYNMEIVTIEKRLSNGYYKRPKDFLHDVKKLTKDARTLGDQERLLRANELQANVEVDMDNIETESTAMNAELEAIYIREMQREKEIVAKAHQAEGKRLQLMPGNVSGETQGLSSGQSSGPVILGEPIRNGVALHPTTPSNPSNPSQPSQRSILTNGLHTGGISDLSDLQPHSSSNGTTGPRESDLQMTNTTDEGHSTERGTQNSSFGPSAQTRPPFSYTGGPASLEQRKSLPGSLSQRSAITPMAEGSNPQDYTNYASTTTSSGKRVSGSSGPFNTQSSHGRNDGPDLSMIPEPLASNSQLPETQGSQSTSNPASSQSLSQHPTQPASQYPAVPPFNRPSNPHGSIHHLLTTDVAPKHSSAVSKLVTDPSMTDNLLEYLTEQTSGYSVEQLEQVYSALMDQIWKTRGEWNRVKVIGEVRAAFEEVTEDIKACQDLCDRSMEIGIQDESSQYGTTTQYGTTRYESTKYGTSQYGEIEG